MENGDGSRTSSQSSLEVLWDKAFLLPNNVATKNWHFFLVEGDPRSQCSAASSQPDAHVT